MRGPRPSRARTVARMNASEVRKSFDEKVRRGIFRPVARHLPESIREERLHDAVCQTFKMYQRYARRGTLLPDAILVHSCRQRRYMHLSPAAKDAAIALLDRAHGNTKATEGGRKQNPLKNTRERGAPGGT